ncbi:MAG: flagellar basal body rod protein FlgB [Firmicutes bacterium]|nr:flagellar basal body rod protein FlgB [Bacillota bacterium]
MVGRVVNDATMSLLEKGLDLASVRHRAISGNLANANTPGYKRRDVSFETVMRRAIEGSMSGGDDEDVPIERVVMVDGNRSQRNDGNNVDVDYEMTVLGENTIIYNAIARQLSLKLALMRTVITEGRR